MSNDPFSIDDALVRKLAGLLDETRLTEIEYAWGEHRIRVTRQPSPVQAAVATAAPASAATTSPAAPEDLTKHPGVVTSPMVGTVYLSPQPGAAPFIRVGDTIAAGQPLLIVEAMKVMNQIRSTKAGRVARILVDDTAPVEFGQPLVILE
jgi:acetyl-CoA carboxylase biotin carboxyl carrier protein